MVDQPSPSEMPNVIDMPLTKKRSRLARRSTWILSAITVVAVFAAAYFAGQASALRQSQRDLASNNPLGVTMPTLEASGAVTSEKFSMATGYMSQNAEGLFVLDHNSGLLQCSVMYPRRGQFLGLFTTNVHDALGSGKGAAFMMTTGMVDMPSSNNNPVAASVIYVLNTSTGEYACYYIPFNRTMLNSNQPQTGNLVLLAKGAADPIIDRDAIR